MARRYFGTKKRSGFKVALLFLALVAVVVAVMGTAGSSFALDGSSGNAYVNSHRDRLLDTYAQYKGLGDRVNAWNSLNLQQRKLFLIQTDLLGNRTFMRPVPTDYYLNNPNDNGFKNIECGNGDAYCGTCQAMGGVQYCTTCEVYAEITDWGMGCKEMSAWDCYQAGLCYQGQPRPRTDYEMALEHVTKLYEILAPSDDCGGDDNNRIFWQAGTDSSNDQLIQAFRNRTMPGWSANVDLGNPLLWWVGSVHSPFENASSTLNRQPWSCLGPDGQAQFYSWDRVCTFVEYLQGQTSPGKHRRALTTRPSTSAVAPRESVTRYREGTTKTDLHAAAAPPSRRGHNSCSTGSRRRRPSCTWWALSAHTSPCVSSAVASSFAKTTAKRIAYLKGVNRYVQCSGRSAANISVAFMVNPSYRQEITR